MTPTENLQQEAEQLYPLTGDKNVLACRPYSLGEAIRFQQAAHVACAEKYTAIIEGHIEACNVLAKACEEKDKEIERLRAENERLKTPEAMREAMVEYYTWRVTSGWELHSSGDYYYRSKDRHQWPPEETCELHELFQHFLKDANKASALKTPTP